MNGNTRHHAPIGDPYGNTIVVVGEPLPEQALDTAVDPAAIVQQSFDTERRGFDQRQVQQYLRAVADSLGDAQKREADMRTRLGRAVRRAEAAEQALRDTPEGQAAELNRELGDQVESVLEAARVTGDQRVTAAEKSAEQMLANAKADAAAMRAQAESVLQERSEEADRAATELVGEGQTEAQALREQAKVDAHARLTDAADRVERVRDECDGLIREAEEARAQILEDMERRRRQARAQVERLRVGRDRLLRSYEVVRRTLEETTVELKSSLNEAKVRGDGAARAIAAEPMASREQLEAELRDAKMIGRITISDPTPGTSTPPDTAHAEDAQSDTAPLDANGSLRSPALPRPLDTSPASDVEAAAASRRPRVSEAMKKGATGKAAKHPKAPASAPPLTASTHTDAPQDPIAVMMAAAEAKEAAAVAAASAAVEAELGPIDPELAGLEDDNLTVVEPADEIEEVLAVPVEGDVEQSPAAPGLFAALRAQRPGKKKAAAAKIAAAKSTSVKKAPAATAKTATTAPSKTKTVKVEKSAAKAAKAAKAEKPAAKAEKPAAKTAKAEKPAAKAAKAEKPAAKAAKAEKPAAKAAKAEKPAAKAAAKVPTAKTAASKTAAVKTVSEPAATESSASRVAAPSGGVPAHLIPGIEAQRDAVIADAAKQLERRLKRALADEQNELLAGIRAAKKNVALTAIVGDIDTHLNRYVVAIHEVAAVTYGAGAALIDAEAAQGTLPAGAVEELLESDVISPIRQRLESLDDLKVDAADLHVDPVRAFYRQRKIEHLGDAASRLANLLCVAGVCDALPQESALPWAVAAK